MHRITIQGGMARRFAPLFFLLAAGLFSLCFASPASAADLKIGVVDFQRILKESAAGKAAQAEIEKKGKEMEASLQTKKDEIDGMREKLEREALVMNKEQREEREREIRIKINDAKSLQKKFRDEFKAFEARIIKRIQTEFFELVENLGKRQKYDLIIEKMGVLYATDSVDLTDQLIKLYNTKY